MKNFLTPGLILCLTLNVVACDLLPLETAAQQTCQEIAISRLKHPKSYDFVSVSEKIVEDNQKEVYLNFNAWNDFKVPFLHSISCRYQDTGENSEGELLAIKWNGRPIRQHELDDIRDSLK
ncbi:MAG: hypothetical protein COB54_00425 [Alphaproteobacteria bacterium]|nr:MAG: hypothetical protein COB54_00425 [Alphaproteobacteria bacterium]